MALRTCAQIAGVKIDSADGLIEGFCQQRLVFGTADLKLLYAVGDDSTSVRRDTLQECTNLATGCRFAVKVYDLKNQLSAQKHKILQRNIVADIKAKHLLPKHPNLVRYERCILSPRRLFVVLEYVEGRDLLAVVEEQGCGFPEWKAKKIFKQVSEAVASLHDQSFVHGDIKLENIMIDADDNVKLVDFGLASFNYEAVSVVSDHYLAPEDLKTGAVVTKESEVWRLGCTIYTALTATFPFSKDVWVDGSYRKMIDEQALLKGELEADSPELFWISDTAKDLLHRIFIVDARDRPSVHEILAHEWFS